MSRIVSFLKDAEGGIAVVDLLRKLGINKATFVKWRSMRHERFTFAAVSASVRQSFPVIGSAETGEGRTQFASRVHR